MIAVHADWSVAAGKRWMALALPSRPPDRAGWVLSIAPVGPVDSLAGRLLRMAEGCPVALGIDCPIGLPRAFVARHLDPAQDFPAFLRTLAGHPTFFDVAETLADVGPARPFYPRRGARGMTRLSHAQSLGLADAAGLHRACDRATATRPAGAPPFWTLGANQSGKAAIAAWRDLLLPGLAQRHLRLWPFEGPFCSLLAPNRIAVAETYPAEALRQLGLRPIGSKRRQADRAAMAPALGSAISGLLATPDDACAAWLQDGFGADAAGEDRFDCLLGVLGVLLVLARRRPDAPPADPWLRRWEGWVLGQA